MRRLFWRRAGFLALSLCLILLAIPVPTRAEVADIYNGALDGAAALMLTGETAIGKHPVEAMTYLAKTARCAMRDMEEMQTQEET